MLMLHRGGQLVQPAELANVPTPAATQTHYPISHADLLNTVRHRLTGAGGFECVREEHALAKQGDRYFGVLQLRSANATYGDRAICVGIRNSHDKTFSAGLVMGNRVFCCDNLSFSGEVTLSRKHTRFISNDLERLVSRAVATLISAEHKQTLRFDQYKAANLDDRDAAKLLMDALTAKAVTTQKVEAVWSQWRKPDHEEFAERNAWSLFNAFTEVYKGDSLDLVRKRSQLLQGTIDTFVGLSLAT
jgi:hypothetical protein